MTWAALPCPEKQNPKAEAREEGGYGIKSNNSNTFVKA